MAETPGVARRAGWTLADQGVSSAGNASVAILAARALPAAGFGAYGLAFAAYLVVLGIGRAAATEPFTVRFAGRRSSPLGRDGNADAAVGASVVVAAAASLLVLVTAAILDSEGREVCLVLSCALPVLLVQDAVRCVAIAAGRPREALINDAAWTVAALAGAIALSAAGSQSPAAFLSTWAAGAAVGAGVSLRRLGVRPRPVAGARFLRRHADLAGRFSAQFGLQIVGTHVLTFSIALAASVAVVGGLEAAQSLIGPVALVVMGTTMAALPELVRVNDQPARLLRGTVVMATVLAGFAAMWGALVLAVPDALGATLYGRSWPYAEPLLLPVALIALTGASMQAPATALRALGRAAAALRVQFVNSVLMIALAIAGAVAGGARGALFGWATGGGVGVALWWVALRHETRGAFAPARRPAVSPSTQAFAAEGNPS